MKETSYGRVLGTFNSLIYEDLKVIDRTLSQVAELSGAAHDQIYFSIEEISNVIDECCNISSQVPFEDQSIEVRELLQVLRELPNKFEADKDKMMLSMQATDMINQLLTECRDRMNRINRLSRDAGKVAGLFTGDVGALVASMQTLLSAQVIRMQEDFSSAVEQTNVDEGDIELF